MDTTITQFDLKIRYQVYRFFADNCRAPAFHEIADLLNVEREEVRVSFHNLHERHMLFLEPGSDRIRIANPFSAISFIRFVRICTSTQRPSGPTTVVCSDS